MSIEKVNNQMIFLVLFFKATPGCEQDHGLVELRGLNVMPKKQTQISMSKVSTLPTVSSP